SAAGQQGGWHSADSRPAAKLDDLYRGRDVLSGAGSGLDGGRHAPEQTSLPVSGGSIPAEYRSVDLPALPTCAVHHHGAALYADQPAAGATGGRGGGGARGAAGDSARECRDRSGLYGGKRLPARATGGRRFLPDFARGGGWTAAGDGRRSEERRV